MALVPRLPAALARPFVGVGRWAAARPLSTPALVEFCRSIRFFLVSGMTLRDGMRSLAEKGTYRVRGVAAAVAGELSGGWSLEDALTKQGEVFPPLFRSLAVVGEETGKLPEVMADLERYYEHHQRQQRQLVGQAMKPLIQYVLAVLVVSGLILFLSFLPSTKSSGGMKKQTIEVVAEGGGTKTVEAYLPVGYDPLGLGLTGERGAATFLAVGFAIPVALWLVYRLLRWAVRGQAVVDRVVLRLPFVGGAARALALARFSFAMHLILDSSMSILKTVRLAFPATGNGAFARAAAPAEAVLRRGNPVVVALEDSRLFPPAYLSAAAIGEQTGHLPEVMTQQADFYAEAAERRVNTIYAVLGYLVWIGVAVFIAFLVVKLFSTYIEQIDTAQRS
jgi:type II secretory pathway component PulF